MRNKSSFHSIRILLLSKLMREGQRGRRSLLKIIICARVTRGRGETVYRRGAFIIIAFRRKITMFTDERGTVARCSWIWMAANETSE